MITISRSGPGTLAPAPLDTVGAVWRGVRGRCPACGTGRLFGRFLKVADGCTECGQAYHHHRADDFPPYLVMFAVGHLIGFGIYTAETRFEDVPIWFHALVWPSLAIGLSLALLQPVKGAVVGLQYGLGMHGFGAGAGASEEIDGGGGTGRAAEVGLRERRPAEALAEQAPEGRRHLDSGGQGG